MGHQDDTPWLVKSGGRVLGPYTKLQIEQFLKTREFVVLDEVSRPFHRWRYIRDENVFAAIVESLRKKNLEHTEEDPTFTGSESGTMTAPITDFFDMDDMTPRPAPDMKEIVVENVDDGFDEKKVSSPKGQFQKADQVDKSVLNEQVNEKVRHLWFIVFLVLFGLFGFILYKHFLGDPIKDHLLVKDTISRGKEALMLGRYQQALEEFKSVHRINPNEKSIYPYLAILYIQVDGQTLMGKRLFEQVLDQNLKNKHLALAGMGLAELIDGHFEKAKTLFRQALAEKPGYAEAEINLGITEFLSRKYNEASERFKQILRSGAKEPVANLMLVESHLYLWRSTKDSSYIAEAQNVLNQMIETTNDYLQEALLIVAYTSYFTGDRGKAMDFIYKFLDLDPDLTKNHRHNLFIYRERVSWDFLLQWCEQLAKELNSDPYVKAMHSLCLSKSSRALEAKALITDALNQSPKDGLLQAVYAYVLQSRGEGEAASMALGRSIEMSRNSQFILPYILQARFCHESGDYRCALNNWQRIANHKTSTLSATAGIAQSHLDLKNFSETQKFLLEGFKISQTYKPLLEVKNYAEKKGVLPHHHQ